MVACDLSVVGVFEFAKTEDGRDVPALPVSIFRRSLGRSVRTLAIVDTGFDLGLLVSREVRDRLLLGGPPEAHTSLRSGALDVPCEVFRVSVKVIDRWFDVEGFSPIFPGYETLLGMGVLQDLNLCLRGTSRRVCLAQRG